MLGDVVPNRRKIIPASNLDNLISDAYAADIAVLAALHVFETSPTLVEEKPDPFGHLHRGQDSLNVVEGEPGKLLAGVTESMAGRLVELGKAQRFGVDQHDSVSGLIEDGAVDFLPFAQRFLRRPRCRDVAGDAEYADQAGGAAHGRLDGFEQGAMIVGGELEPFFVDARLAGLNGGQIVRPEEIGQFRIDEVVVGLTDNFRLAGAEKAFEGRVAVQIDPLGVLQPNQIGNGPYQRPEMNLDAFQITQGLFLLADIQADTDQIDVAANAGSASGEAVGNRAAIGQQKIRLDRRFAPLERLANRFHHPAFIVSCKEIRRFHPGNRFVGVTGDLREVIPASESTGFVQQIKNARQTVNEVFGELLFVAQGLLLADLLRDVARHADDRRTTIPLAYDHAGIHQGAPAVRFQQGQWTACADSGQHLGDHAPGLVAHLGRMNGPDGLAEQRIPVAQTFRYRRVVVQDAAFQIEHEQIIGDGFEQTRQISPLPVSLFLGEPTL